MKIIIYILMILIPSILLFIIDLKSFIDDHSKSSLTKNFLKDFFVLNLTSFTIATLIFNYKNVFIPLKQSYTFFLAYFGISILVMSIYILIKYEIKSLFKVEKVENLNKRKSITLYVFSIIFFFVGVLAISGTVWAKQTYNDVKFDQIIVTLLSPANGTDPVIVFGFIERALLISVTLTYIFALIFYKRVNFKYNLRNDSEFVISEHSTRITTIVLSSCILLSGVFYSAWRFDIRTIIISYTQSSPYIGDNYIDPADVKLEFPKQKRNLIHIYLESMENSYFSRELGGNMKENLMPNLYDLYSDGINFSNRENGQGYGGPLETYGCTWSVASMVNQFFGFPMKVPTKNNAYGKPGEFFSGAVGMGDILSKAGYQQTIAMGADATFGGKRFMFGDHGNFKIMDHKFALENKMIPEGYKVNWGYEDDKLYEFAKDELNRLASSKEPFHFMLENTDTHFPGFAFDGDNPIYEDTNDYVDYAKTIKFSDKNTASFIRWIQQQPFYENTTVVIVGDHLSMDKSFFIENDFNDYLRTTYNLILNPSPELEYSLDRFYNRQYANYDFMPTILASIGVKIEGNRLGLGTNLFSNEPTIFERDGYDYVNEEFIRKSPYYSENLLSGELNYSGDNIFLY